MTTSEVAKCLGVTRQRVQKMRHRGVLGAKWDSIQRQWIFSRREVNAWKKWRQEEWDPRAATNVPPSKQEKKRGK